MQHRNIGFFCGSLDRLQWEEDNGNTGLWIKHYHFWPGGQFENVMPEHLVSVPKAKDADRRFDINERRADWIHHLQEACVVCGIPPMRDPHNGKALLYWVKSHHPNLFAELVQVINVMQPKPTFSTWVPEVSKIKAFLVAEVLRMVRDSLLQADHGIPKAVLKELWATWDRDMRKVATNTLAFGYCRPHNNGKSKRLPSREELLRLHIQINFDAKEELARADSTWKPIQRVLDSIDAYRPVYLRTNSSANAVGHSISAPAAEDEVR